MAAVFGVKLLTNSPGLLIGRGRKSQISRDFWRQILGKIGRFRGSFRGKPHQKAIGKKGAILWLFSWQISLEIDQFGADQTSINEPMAKPFISWLVPSFSQHNLHLVVSGRCLHVPVTKFQDKFANLRQVNSPYSWNKFQICCTDMYLIRFLPNFAVFFVFLWISRDFADLPQFRGSATARNIRSPEIPTFSWVGGGGVYITSCVTGYQ